MQNSLPEILYKYRTWDNDFNKLILTKSEIYFSAPSMFNDPFDCAVPIRYDILSKDDIVQKSRTMLKRDEPTLNRSGLRKESKSRLKPGYYKNSDYQIKYQKEYRENSFGIYSLSADPNNIVMWSHYANSHKGFCVGFHTKALIDHLKTIHKNNGPLVELAEIDYQLEYPILDPRKLGDQEYVVKPLTIKSLYWDYEKEYRLVSINGNKFSIKLPNYIYAEVILGCKISKENRDEIKSIIKKDFHNINFYYSEMGKENFDIKFLPIKFRKIKKLSKA